MDGSAELLHELAALGEIEVFENIAPTRKSPQQNAYDQLIGSEFIHNAGWLAVLDVNEFLNVHVGDFSVQSLIDFYDDIDFISLNWVTFGDSGFDQ